MIENHTDLMHIFTYVIKGEEELRTLYEDYKGDNDSKREIIKEILG